MVNKMKSGFSFLLALVLILSSVNSFAEIGNRFELLELDNESITYENDVLDKIQTEVQDIMLEGDNELLDVLIYMKDKANVKRVSKNNAIGMTPYSRELSSRKAVINELRDVAEESQGQVLKYLYDQERLGNVKSIESFYIVNMINVKARKSVIENIANMDFVEKIYLNETINLDPPEKIENGLQLNLNTDEIEWNIKQIGAHNVWEKFGIDGTGVVVGIIDSGVDWDNPALINKWRGYNPQTGETNPIGNWYDAQTGRTMPYDDPLTPHGSHVTGTVLGSEADGTNMIGVAPGAKWIAAKALSSSGGSQANLLAAAQWMLAPGGKVENAPDIVNNSWGGSATTSEWFKDIVDSWRAANILPVFAAGNQKSSEPLPWPGSIQNPANLLNTFSVAATDINNKRGSFSKLGPSLFDPSGTIIKPEISAPGVNIRSSVIDGYESGWNGTSMAAPHISGVAALMIQANPNLTVDQIEDIIEETAIPLTDNTFTTSPNMGYGYGLVNAFDAVSKVLGTGQGTIEGRVVTEGEDIELPSIIHEKGEDVFENEEIVIQASIADDISITEVKLLIKNNKLSEWLEIPMFLTSGTVKGGIYEGRIDTEFVIRPGVQYKIAAKDYGNNQVETEVYTINTLFGVKPNMYTNNFESDVKGWRFDGEFSWGTPGSSSISEPKPYSGTKLIGTKVGSYDVTNNMTSTAITPPIDLRDSNLVSAKAVFYQWHSISYFHAAKVEVSVDNGSTWTLLRNVTGANTNWHEVEYDLTDYIGNDEPVYLRMSYITSDSGYSTGWYIDDFKVTGLTTDDPIPVTGVTLDRQELILGLEDRYALVATISPKNATNKNLTWQSSDSSVVRVDENGLIMALGLGNASITVTTEDGNMKAVCNTTVVEVGETPVDFIVPGGYSNDFETNIEGWVLEGDWSWDIPTDVKEPSGSKVLGTKIGSPDISSNLISNLILPPIDLSDSSLNSASLEFDQWVDIGIAHTAKFEISIDGGTTYKPLRSVYSNYGVWDKEYISLNKYIGELNPILIRLQFDSNPKYSFGTESVGWYIDNIELNGMDLVSPTVPTGLTAKTTTAGVKLNWNPINDLDFKEYNLYRGTTPSGDKIKITTTTANNTEYIDTNVFNDTIYYYVIEAVDYAGNISRSEVLEHNYIAIQRIFEEDFEDDNGNFTTGILNEGEKNSWQWGIPKHFSGPTTGLTGEKIWATNLTGYYDNNHSGYIESPTIVLPEELDPVLQVDQWIEVWNSYGETTDYGSILISEDDGENWVVLKDKIVGSSKWETISIDLTEYSGKSIKLRFVFYSNGLLNDPGWYIDSISITLKSTTTTNNKILFEPIPIQNLPIDAVVTILETGRSTRTDLSTGYYRMKHVASSPGTKYTILAEAYGFHSKQFEVRIDEDETLVKNISLNPMGRGNILGTIVNGHNEPIKNAKVRIIEEPGITDIITDDNGNFFIEDILEGLYTIKVTSEGYYSETISFTVLVNIHNEVEITLEREFIADENEIAYDDGTYEDRRVFVNAGAGFGVRFTPEKYGRLKSAKIYFVDDHKTALGNEINIGVVKLDERGNILHFAPMKTIIINRGAWNEIDLTEFDVITDEDFYIVTQQIHPIANSPGIGIDISSTANRSYVYNGGSLASLNNDYNIQGGMLIRAIMEYPNNIPEPIIEIENIEPSEDIVLGAGELLEVSFNGPVGKSAYFRVVLPYEIESNKYENSMVEIEAGFYVGTWSIPKGLLASELMIEVVLENDDGSRIFELAPGRLTIVEITEELPSNAVIIGEEAFDIRFLDANEEAQNKLKDLQGLGKEIYVKLNPSTLVNGNGEIVDMNILYDRILYWDKEGALSIYKK